MADNKDIVELEINVEVTRAQKNVNALAKEVEKLTKSLRAGGITEDKVRKNTDELANAKARLALEERKLSNAVAKQTNAEQNSTSAVNKQIQALKLEQAQLSKNSAAYQKNASEISRLSGGLNAQSRASGAATSSVMELGRVISDAPYGMRGMANNLSQLVSLMFYASTAAGGLSLALKQMWKAMMGPLGLVLAITTVISTLDFLSTKVDKTKKAMGDLNAIMTDNASKLYILKQALDDTNISLEAKTELVKLAKNEFEDLNIELDENGQLTLASANALALYTQQLIKTSKAKAILELITKNQKLALEEENKGAAESISWYQQLYIGLAKFNEDYIWGDYMIKGAAEQMNDMHDENVDEYKDNIKKFEAMLLADDAELALLLWGDLKKGPKKKKDPKPPKDKVSKDHSLKQFDWTNYNNKLFDKHMKLFIHQEKAKLAYQQGAELRDLQGMRNLHKKKEAIRLSNFLKKQNLIINDETQSEGTRQSARDASAAAQKAYNEEEVRAEAEHLQVMDNLKEMHTDQTVEFDYHADMEEKRRLLEKQGFKQKMAEHNSSFMGLTIKKDYDARFAQIDAEIALNKEELALAEKQGRDLEEIEKKGDKLAEKRAKTQMELDAEVYAAKKAMMNDVMDSAISVFSTMKNAQEKGSKEEKKYALMEIYAGAAKGLMNGVLIAGEAAQGTAQAAPFIYASVLATQFASIYGAVSQAKSVLNGGSPSGGGTKVETPEFAPNFNVVGNSNQNQLAQSIQDQTNGPTRAYVVYEDIAEAGETSAQSIESSGI